MNGLSIIAGIGPKVSIGGREFQVRGKTNEYYAEVEAAIKKLRGNPLDLIVEGGKRAKLEKDPTVLSSVATIVSEKFRNWNTATYHDYLEFMDTPEGDALTVWHCLKQDAKDLTLEQVKQWLIQVRFYGGDGGRQKLSELFQAIAVASGEDQLGNSFGQPGPVSETKTDLSTGS